MIQPTKNQAQQSHGYTLCDKKTAHLQSFVNTYCGQHDDVPDGMFVIGLLSFLANFDSQLLAL